jgi:hypothetical protein
MSALPTLPRRLSPRPHACCADEHVFLFQWVGCVAKAARAQCWPLDRSICVRVGLCGADTDAPSSAAFREAGATVIPGDMNDVAGLTTAFEGAQTVFIIVPGHEVRGSVVMRGVANRSVSCRVCTSSCPCRVLSVPLCVHAVPCRAVHVLCVSVPSCPCWPWRSLAAFAPMCCGGVVSLGVICEWRRVACDEGSCRRHVASCRAYRVAQHRERLGVNAIEAAKAAGVKHVVLQSISTADLVSTTYGRQFYPVEIAMKTSGIPFTILRLPLFTDNNW